MTFWRSQEGMIFIAGLGMTLVFLGIVGGLAFQRVEIAEAYFGMAVANLLAGRAAGISFGLSFGISAGVSSQWVLILNMAVETIQVLLFYPVFHWSWDHFLRFGWLRRWMRRTRKSAEKHRATLERYGTFGIFLFVWLPLPMTGPVVGSAIGYLMGLRPCVNIALVLSGTYLATLGWFVILRHSADFASRDGTSGAHWILGAILIGVLGAAFWKGRSKIDEG